MKIHIFDEIITKYDKKIISLLEVSPEFVDKVAEIRVMIGIPKTGVDEETAFFEKDCLFDNQGKKVKLARPFPPENTPEAYAYMESFLDDPDYAFSSQGIYRDKVESLRSYFNLEDRWYHPFWHIIIFSSIGWLHSPITAFIDKPEKISIWYRPGIVIRVTDDIPIKQLNNWLKENWNELRKRLNSEIGIIKKKGLPKDNSLELSKEIIKLKTADKSFERLSGELTEKYDERTKEYKTVVDSGNIEKIYLRYRKLFGLALRNRHKK